MHRRLLLLLALVLLAGTSLVACGDDDEPAAGDSNDAPADTATDAGAGDGGLTISGFAFSPDPLEVVAGSSVTVTNDDGAAHTWTADDGTFDSGSLASGDTFEHTFTDAGEVAFHCEIHPSMTGTVVVG